MKKNIVIYLMLLPTVVYFIIFSYYPLISAIEMSFRKVIIYNSDKIYIGFDNYKTIFNDVSFWDAFQNTFIFAFWNCFLGVVLPCIVAIMLNEIRHRLVRSLVQTTIYLPTLWSWVVVGSAFTFMLSPNIGPINQLSHLLGLPSNFNYFNNIDIARGLIIFINQWKITGFGVIIYMAAIVGISMEQYEAGTIDGANRFQQIIFITIPNISNTIKVMFMLNIMGMFQLFDPIYVLTNRVTQNHTDVLMTYIYRTALGKMQLGTGAAASVVILFIALIFTLIAKRLTKFGFED